MKEESKENKPHHRTGKKWDEATKKKISETKKGKKRTDAEKKAISEGKKGKKLTKEHRDKVVKTLKPFTKEVITEFKTKIYVG